MARTLDDWLKSYLVYTAGCEPPEEFHIWTALSTVAGAIGRRVYVDMGYFSLFPNLYVVLNAPQGKCRKGTALRLGREILAQVPNAKFSGESSSRERLIMDMQAAYTDGQSALTIHSSEFGSFFATSREDMAMFLTDIFDCPPTWTHKTKTGGSSKIQLPYLNLAAATTPDWMAEAITLRTVGIGLTGRIIFVFQDTPRAAKPIPIMSPEIKELGKWLTNDLIHISTIQGEFKFTPEADAAYSNWYLARFKDNEDTDPRLSGYFERKHIHALKVAMIVSLMRKDTTILEECDIALALELLGRIEGRMHKAFSAVGKNPLSQDIEMIGAAIIRRPDGITDSELMDRFKFSVDMEQFNKVIQILTTIGYVKSGVRKDGRVLFFPKHAPEAVIKQRLSETAPSANSGDGKQESQHLHRL